METAHLISNVASPSQVREDACTSSPHLPGWALGQGGRVYAWLSSCAGDQQHNPHPGSTVTLLPVPKQVQQGPGLEDASLQYRQAKGHPGYVGGAMWGSPHLRVTNSIHSSGGRQRSSIMGHGKDPCPVAITFTGTPFL